MRRKNQDIMEQIISIANRFHKEMGRSPSTTEIANEVGIGRGTAYTYLTAMRDRGMIGYDGKDIITSISSLINHTNDSTPIVGRVVCGDAMEAEKTVKEYVDLPSSIFGKGEKFILKAYGDSMNLAGIEEGDYVVVRKQNTAEDGDLVIALTNGENNLKRIYFDNDRKVVALCPESDNPSHKKKEYREVDIQGVVTHVIKRAV